MKRTGGLLERILEWDNLLLAYQRARLGLACKEPAERYSRALDHQLSALREGLANGSFDFGKYRSFVVRDPKRRLIHAPGFPARVAHHAIFNICEPFFDRRLVSATYACRKGFGTHGAISRAAGLSRKYAWHLQMDVRKFFDSIPHSELLTVLGRVFKERELMVLFRSILGGYHSVQGVDRGLPIGSLASQHFANLYLGSLDRLVIEVCRIRGYVRYMDDFVLWANTPDELLAAREKILCHLDCLGLRLKRKSTPQPSCHGLGFLGHRIYPHRIILARRSRTRYVRKARIYGKQFAKGEIDELKLQAGLDALSGFGKLARMGHLNVSLLQEGL